MNRNKGKTGAFVDDKPLPPNIFLYIQLAQITQLPSRKNPLEIHLDQGGSLIVKCVEHYNTDGIITQDEFNSKPTYTLVFQQDNLDRINHATDNPLLIKLYMRWREDDVMYEDEEIELMEEASHLLSFLIDQIDSKTDAEIPDVDSEIKEPNEEMILLSVGFIDIVKLFGHHRCMLREELLLYPVPDCPFELRCTVKTEWHLYTLVPIAKEITFTNMAFIKFESIYNVKEEYGIDVNTLNVELSFRSVLPLDRNAYHEIPWCTFQQFTESCIETQNINHVFEYFRNSVPNSNCIGLKSPMKVQLHQLFHKLFRSEDMNINFDLINVSEDLAFVCNTFHRFILTKAMTEILLEAIAWRRYIIAVDVYCMQEFEKKEGKRVIKVTAMKKVFSGILDPAILIYPDVQAIRFAVELKFLGTVKKKQIEKKASISSTMRRYTAIENDMPTFGIISICLMSPLGQALEELRKFNDSYIGENRLIDCKRNLFTVKPMYIKDIQKHAYGQFDKFMRETITYIVEKNVTDISQKRGFFCCSLQNLINILLKIVGCDFNLRERTRDNVEFTNLCVIAFNELEQRIHSLLEKIEEEGLEESVRDTKEKENQVIDHLNAVKILRAVGDQRMSKFFYEKVIWWVSGYFKDQHFISRTEKSNRYSTLFQFFDLIAKMEMRDYVSARIYFQTEKQLCEAHAYYAGWIRIYLDYVATRDDPDPKVSQNSNECLLNSVTLYSERFENVLDGWILLFCYYKRFNYAPGYSYARWRLENLVKNERGLSATAPYSLWGISLNITPLFDTNRGNVFFNSFKIFVRLALYEFAQVIWEDIQNECGLPESYMITTQLKILLNQLEDDFETVTFDFEDHIAEDLMNGFNAQLNGNAEYHRGNFEEAAEFYKRNLSVLNFNSVGRDNMMLSKLRLAYMSYETGDYETTVEALQIGYVGQLLPLVCNYLLGKAYYRMGDLSKAMECFVTCTKFETHVPDVWGFLALINLQLGNNMNAILCWKYAKVDATRGITDETIFEELDKIDIDTVDLYIDVPSPSSGSSSMNDDEED